MSSTWDLENLMAAILLYTRLRAKQSVLCLAIDIKVPLLTWREYGWQHVLV